MPKIYQGVIVELNVSGRMKSRKARIKRAVEQQVPGAAVKFVKSLYLGDNIRLEKVEVSGARSAADEATARTLVSRLMDFLPRLERRIKESKAWVNVARSPRGAKV